MKFVAESFTWPFRGAWKSSWAIGIPVVLLSPVLFIPLLGYAVAATRAAEIDPSAGPPPWRIGGRLLTDGAWTFAAVLLTAAPFLLVLAPLSNALYTTRLWSSTDTGLARFDSVVLAMLVLLLPWGLVALLLLPHATARFAATGRARDLFDAGAAIRGVRGDFATWNVSVAAIVTGWVIGLACVGLLCVGLVPGIYYAILVSAHASAALNPKEQDSRPSTR